MSWTLGIIIPTTAWMVLAAYYRARSWWTRIALAIVPLAVVGFSLWWLPFVPWALAVWLGVFALALAWFFSLRPRADRDWAPGMTILPRVQINGDTIHIRQYRNFDYDASGQSIPRYEDRSFDLSKLRSLDYFLSHWSGPVMAHTLVSFGFDDGQYLAVSVEARRRSWQTYSPLRGLFRSYELMYVFGDERDILRLRTNIRRERVYLYRLRLPVERIRRLLLDYLSQSEKLAESPQWYNSVTSNCTTNLFYHQHRRVPLWSKPGIFFNGLSARTLYRLGILAAELPFKQLQARSAIRELALAAGDVPDFSHRIRAQMVEPRAETDIA